MDPDFRFCSYVLFVRSIELYFKYNAESRQIKQLLDFNYPLATFIDLHYSTQNSANMMSNGYHLCGKF